MDLVRIAITMAWQARRQRPVQTTRIVSGAEEANLFPDVSSTVPDVNLTVSSLISASKKLGKTVKKSEYEGKGGLHAPWWEDTNYFFTKRRENSSGSRLPSSLSGYGAGARPQTGDGERPGAIGVVTDQGHCRYEM